MDSWIRRFVDSLIRRFQTPEPLFWGAWGIILVTLGSMLVARASLGRQRGRLGVRGRFLFIFCELEVPIFDSGLIFYMCSDFPVSQCEVGLRISFGMLLE